MGYDPERPGGPAHLAAGRFMTRSHYEMQADLKTGLGLGELVRLGRNNFTVGRLTRHQMSSPSMLRHHPNRPLPYLW